MDAENTKQKDFLRGYQSINRKLEEEEAAKKAVSLGVEYMDLTAFPVDISALGTLTKPQAQEVGAAIFYKDGDDMRIGSVDPTSKVLAQYIVDFKRDQFKPKIYFISHSSFQHLIELYDKVPAEKIVDDGVVRVIAGQDYAVELPRLSDPNQHLTATQMLSTILGAAQQYGTSDIHVEPEEGFVKVRYRMDGVLQDRCHVPNDQKHSLTSRIKMVSKLKLNVTTAPQDGRFTFDVSGQMVDVRVSTLPSPYGEGIVMRLLGNQAVNLKLDDLGFVGRSYDIIKRELGKPNGAILTTGPTGSGKTTTLYAFLNQLNEAGVKIITLEDPVEYKLQGINQTPIDAAQGMSFASGLRAILRQDPDIIMVGEIRDQETAETAFQAALTGHVVLSTLHTNDAAGAIPRLLNMGVKPYVVSPALNAVIAQRLVRRLCPVCKKETQLSPDLMDQVKKTLADVPPAAKFVVPPELKFYTAPGCDACHNTGYKGRIGIYEVVAKTEAIEKLIIAVASAAEIKRVAISEGMVTMAQDGLMKALQGITDVEEVFRVAQD